MNCRHVRVLLSAYLDSELTGYEMLAIREHLAHCDDCSDERQSLELVRSMVRALPQREPREEWIGALQNQAFYASLPIGERLKLLFIQDFNFSGARGRRLASAAMLSVIGLFLAAGTFENVPVQRFSYNENQDMLPAPPRLAAEAFNASFSEPHLMSPNQEIQFLDPRQHPADLTRREPSLALINALEPQPRYNNVTLTSFTSLGNQLVSSR